jgi:hypothetical protein
MDRILDERTPKFGEVSAHGWYQDRQNNGRPQEFTVPTSQWSDHCDVGAVNSYGQPLDIRDVPEREWHLNDVPKSSIASGGFDNQTSSEYWTSKISARSQPSKTKYYEEDAPSIGIRLMPQFTAAPMRQQPSYQVRA